MEDCKICKELDCELIKVEKLLDAFERIPTAIVTVHWVLNIIGILTIWIIFPKVLVVMGLSLVSLVALVRWKVWMRPYAVFAILQSKAQKIRYLSCQHRFQIHLKTGGRGDGISIYATTTPGQILNKKWVPLFIRKEVESISKEVDAELKVIKMEEDI